MQCLRDISLSILVCVILAVTASSPEAATFQWPVVDPILGQGYSCKGRDKGCFKDDEYHAGIDMTSMSDFSHAVLAVTSGAATVIADGSQNGYKYLNCNHGMGKVVIIDHHDTTYSLYAHLASIEVSDGQYVPQGTRIGTYGDTGSGTQCNSPSFAPHLHFELKKWGVIGSLHDDIGPPNEWGYTPDFPNLHGYINPRPYFDHDINYIEPKTVLVTSDDPTILTGPNPAEYEQVVGTTARGQRFVAFSEYNGWSQIYFPSGLGSASGWIQGSIENTGTTLEISDTVASSHAGVNVRTEPSTGTASVTRVWNGQFHTQADKARSGNGCAKSWFQLYIPGGGSAGVGWVCGDYIIENRCLNLFSTAVPAPQGYGAAFNALSNVRELLVRASCGGADATLIVGTGMRNQQVYRIGQEWTGTGWRQFNLSGELANGSTDWFVGKASAKRTRSAAQLAQDNLVVAYVCSQNRYDLEVRLQR